VGRGRGALFLAVNARKMRYTSTRASASEMHDRYAAARTDARTTAIGRGIVPRFSAYRPPMRSCGRHCPPPANAQDFKCTWRKICGMTIIYTFPNVSDNRCNNLGNFLRLN